MKNKLILLFSTIAFMAFISPAQAKYNCSKEKTCKQIRSCEEAYYLLNQCGHRKRDKDKDGVPCENLCPGG